MSSSPAADLTHLREVFGKRWRIETSEPGQHMTVVYIASERSTGRKIVTRSLAELGQRLERAGRPGRQ
jgi:hypothetical protein